MLEQHKTELFENKYEMYGNMLFKLCMVYLRNYADAEDALQDAFVKLFYKAPSFPNNESEKAWLVRVTLNICKDKLKTIWNKKVIVNDTFELYYKDEHDINLAESIFVLPQKYRIVIHLFYYENYSIDEIAKILRISKSAVKMRLKRGREQLKFEMEAKL